MGRGITQHLSSLLPFGVFVIFLMQSLQHFMGALGWQHARDRKTNFTSGMLGIFVTDISRFYNTELNIKFFERILFIYLFYRNVAMDRLP